MFYKPFDHIGGLALDTTKPVKHKHQKDVNVSFFCFRFQFLNGVPFGCGYFGSRNAFLGLFQRDAPAMLNAEFPAFDLLHGNIVVAIHLPFGRHAIGESRARRIRRQFVHFPCDKLIVEPDFITHGNLDGFSELIDIIHCPVLLVGHACNSDRSYSFVKVPSGHCLPSLQHYPI